MPEATPETLARMIADARLLREWYLSDPHRPNYHFVVPEGVHAPVDPNGALFWNGRYHLFYIYQHQGAHYWGHVSSLDLVHWRHHPPALGPGEGDAGIYSGGAFIDENGVATITYWRLGTPDGIAIATSTDGNLDHWTKNPNNPVLASTQRGLAEHGDVAYGTADPSQIWFHDGRYYMLTGNLLVLQEFGEKRGMAEHMGDTTYLFVSDDLTHWEYLHPFYQSRREWTFDFEDNMCPDFFPLPGSPLGGVPSGTHMLLFISHKLGCQYYLGRYEADHFIPEQHGRMSWPPNADQYHQPEVWPDHGMFAPESLADDKGRRIMWAWVFDQRTKQAKQASGWSGELTLPRLLWLGEDGTLRMRPADELALLRHRPRSLSDTVVPADTTVVLDEIKGNSLELEVDIHPGAGTARCGVKVCCAPDGSEETVIYYDAIQKTLNVDTRNSGLAAGKPGLKLIESAPFALRDGENLILRVFLDKSIVEVFANERQAQVRRIYPSNSQSVGVALFSIGDQVRVTKLNCWEMMPSNPY